MGDESVRELTRRVGFLMGLSYQKTEERALVEGQEECERGCSQLDGEGDQTGNCTHRENCVWANLTAYVCGAANVMGRGFNVGCSEGISTKN